MTGWKLRGMLYMLVAQRVEWHPQNRIRYTLEGGPPAPRQIYRPIKVQFLRLRYQPGELLFFPGISWTGPPAGGVPGWGCTT